MEFGVLKSVIEKFGTYLDCLSLLRTELLPGEHEGFANTCTCTWTHDFFSLSIVMSSKVNDLRCKKPFSINTRTHCRKIRFSI